MVMELLEDKPLGPIKLPNGMTIKIDFATEYKHEYKWVKKGRTYKYFWRVRLYDKDDNLITELIEENPLYIPLKINSNII